MIFFSSNHFFFFFGSLKLLPPQGPSVLNKRSKAKSICVFVLPSDDDPDQCVVWQAYSSFKIRLELLGGQRVRVRVRVGFRTLSLHYICQFWPDLGLPSF